MRPSGIGGEIWRIYLPALAALTGVEENLLLAIGRFGKPLLAAEWALRGDNIYRDSVILPIRNTYYACTMAEERKKKFEEFGALSEPVLDWGCGVGVTAVLLSMMGYEVQAYDLAGPQRELLCKVAPHFEIQVRTQEDEIGQLGTIVCINTLEHIPNAWDTFCFLQSRCDRLIANCDVSEQTGHVAPMGERERINVALKESGGLWG